MNMFQVIAMKTAEQLHAFKECFPCQAYMPSKCEKCEIKL